MQQAEQRHEYLAAIGVTSWLPCAQLPGAPASAEWVDNFQYPAPEIPFSSNRSEQARASLAERPAAPAVAQKSALNPQAAASGVSAARAALGLVDEAVAPPAPVAEPQIAAADEPLQPLSQPPGEVDSTPPNFKLAFLRIGELLIVDSLPPQGGSFGEQYRLISAAIARALGVGQQPTEPFMLPWPMFASKTLDQGRAQAVIAVQHKLNKELQAEPAKQVLLLGEAAAQMVLDRQEPLESLRAIPFTLAHGAKAICSQSLTEVMQLPGVKKALWRDLQPLLQA